MINYPICQIYVAIISCLFIMGDKLDNLCLTRNLSRIKKMRLETVYLRSVSGDMAKGGLGNTHTTIKIKESDLEIVQKLLISQTDRDFLSIKNDYSSKKCMKVYDQYWVIANELIERGVFLNKWYSRTHWKLVRKA